jgi:hypothetical protein
MISIPSLTFDEIFRFWTYVDHKSEDECWLWLGPSSSKSRPQFNARRRKFLAARVSYYIHYKIDPIHSLVCHDCSPQQDNPLCVNPYHLWLGDHSQNLADYFEKGGIPTFGNQRLSKDQWKLVKATHKAGVSPIEIMNRFKISKTHFYRILRS